MALEWPGVRAVPGNVPRVTALETYPFSYPFALSVTLGIPFGPPLAFAFEFISPF